MRTGARQRRPNSCASEPYWSYEDIGAFVVFVTLLGATIRLLVRVQVLPHSATGEPSAAIQFGVIALLSGALYMILKWRYHRAVIVPLGWVLPTLFYYMLSLLLGIASGCAVGLYLHTGHHYHRSYFCTIPLSRRRTTLALLYGYGRRVRLASCGFEIHGSLGDHARVLQPGAMPDGGIVAVITVNRKRSRFRLPGQAQWICPVLNVQDMCRRLVPNAYPAFLSFRWTRCTTVSGIRSVVYPRLNRVSEFSHLNTPGSLLNMRRIVRSLKHHNSANSPTE